MPDDIRPRDVTFRQPSRDDLETILALLEDDPVSAARQAGIARASSAIAAAFDAIAADPNNELWLAITAAGEVAGTLQLTFIPGLSRNGMRRAQVEAVRVRPDLRGHGIGGQMMRHVIERARSQGCGLVQLTSDLARTDAQRFYRRLGFVASHAGMKLLF
jgi:GNAT superfamily N-acetyltransferase